MIEFESDWNSLSQSLVQNSWIQDGRIQDGCHHQVTWEGMSLSHIELVWFRVRVEWECFWVNLRDDNKVSESKMAVSESNMAEFKMAAFIKLSQNEWVKFFVQNGWILDDRIQDGCHHQCWVRVNEFELDWISFNQSLLQDSWIQDGRIQDCCHHQVKWEWMSLSQIELVWVRVRLEWECFWMNLWKDNKVSESKLAVSESNDGQNSRWLPSSS